MAFRIDALGSSHDRSQFTSHSPALDRYLREQVSQDVRRKVTACFVATVATGRVAGYYTLAAASIRLVDLPAAQVKKLPRYPFVPAVRMGRLAVDIGFRGQKLGAILLADALTRSARSEIAAFALVVDAKDTNAKAFYEHHGLIALAESPMSLFLPLMKS